MLDTLGFGPGIIIIVGVALIITCEQLTLTVTRQHANLEYARVLIIPGSDYVIGVFKRNHPEVYTVAESVLPCEHLPLGPFADCYQCGLHFCRTRRTRVLRFHLLGKAAPSLVTKDELTDS